MMFRILVLQTLYTLSDDQTEYQLRDRLSFMRFVGLALHDPVPDAKTIWLFREQLTRSGTLARLFERFDRLLHERGYLVMGGQTIDATIIEARRPRLTREEKTVLRAGGTPAGWSKARRAGKRRTRRVPPGRAGPCGSPPVAGGSRRADVRLGGAAQAVEAASGQL
jgi:IS5 family transposase